MQDLELKVSLSLSLPHNQIICSGTIVHEFQVGPSYHRLKQKLLLSFLVTL